MTASSVVEWGQILGTVLTGAQGHDLTPHVSRLVTCRYGLAPLRRRRDGVEEPVQVHGRVEIGLAAGAVSDGVAEPHVHFPDVFGSFSGVSAGAVTYSAGTSRSSRPDPPALAP